MTHKWANEIKAWLDGTPVEFRIAGPATSVLLGPWSTFLGPLVSFDNHRLEFRIKKEKKKGWINIYKKSYPYISPLIYATKEDAVAQRRHGEDCAACIEIEYEEGQGL